MFPIQNAYVYPFGGPTIHTADGSSYGVQADMMSSYRRPRLKGCVARRVRGVFKDSSRWIGSRRVPSREASLHTSYSLIPLFRADKRNYPRETIFHISGDS